MADSTIQIKAEVDTTELDEALEKAEQLEEKANLIGMEEVPMVPVAITSFADLDAMNDAQEMVDGMKNVTGQFAEMAENIFLNEQIEDKSGELKNLAQEFLLRIQQVERKEKEQWQPLTDKVINLKNKLFGEKDKPDENVSDNVKSQNGVNIWKSEDGIYYWLALYSNAYRDNDNPPEIISHQSHIDNNKAINNGNWPMPELWLWHVPYPVGKATYHNYNEKSRVTIAGGVFDTGKEHIAKALMNSDWNGVSHGMPKSEIERNDEDETILTRHRTQEISILPLDKAANKLTFNIIGGKQMKLGNLTEAFATLLGEDEVEKIEAALSDTKEVTEEQIVKEEEPKQSEKQEDDNEVIPLTKEDLMEVLKPFAQEMQKLQVDIKSLQDEKEAEKETSINELWNMVKAQSVIGNEQIEVDGRTKLAKEGPEETKEQLPGVMGMFTPMVEQNEKAVL